MRTIPVVVIGGGHSGLAMSKRLSDRGIDHVVLERGQVANSWRTQRWESLRLLTPNWQSRLPGQAYAGDDPDGFMTMPEVIAFVEDYATVVDAPVETETTVTAVRPAGDGYSVMTDQGPWACRCVVLASGAWVSLAPHRSRDRMVGIEIESCRSHLKSSNCYGAGEALSGEPDPWRMCGQNLPCFFRGLSKTTVF